MNPYTRGIEALVNVFIVGGLLFALAILIGSYL
jgi:hypothetical protein